MSILSKSVKPQNFKIDGIKFFKKHLDKIHLDLQVTDHPITTSEITVFMLLHLYTDEMGQIRSLTKDPSISDRNQLNISNLSTEHDLTYETVKKAMDSLIARNYIAEVFTDKGMHYEIVDYATYNHQIDTSIPVEKSSYFRIPLNLYQEKIFGSLIRHRYHHGAALLLDLCQYFTVQVGTNRKDIEDVAKVKGVRTMKYLKETLKTTAMRVRQFLSLIKNIFVFTPVDEKVKTPTNRQKRKRTFTQICIEKFLFSLNPSCFVENDEKNERKLFAASKKEMAARIKHAKIPLKWRDTKDIDRSISRMVNISTHLSVVGKSKSMLDYTLFQVADTLEELHNTGQLSSIKSIGAFVNKSFSMAFNNFQKHFLNVQERIEIITAYQKIYGSVPPFLQNE